MKGRVIPEAKRVGADHYDPPYLPPAQRIHTTEVDQRPHG
jgi:hypothetical protein